MSSASLFAQTAVLALVASISPPALLLAALYLRSERPGKISLFFVAGGLFVVTLIGVAALVAMRAGGLSHIGHHQTRYGVRLGLGLLALVAAVVFYLRRRKAGPGNLAKSVEAAQQSGGADGAGDLGGTDGAGGAGDTAKPGGAAKPKKPKKPKLIQRLSARPSPVTAFLVGVFMFGPSLTFISAVQVVATARTGLADTIGAMTMIIVLAVAFAWLPFLAYLIAPARTLHLLHSLEAALAKHGRTVATAALAVVGLYLTIQGITGLALARHPVHPAN
jgi:hypothetical protein